MMISEAAKAVTVRACDLYAGKLRAMLEREHFGRFVCIEPQSGDFYLGNSIDEAVNQALDAHPDCLTHSLRVGYPAALHMGVVRQ